MATDSITEQSYRAYREERVAASLPPAAIAVFAMAILYAGVDIFRRDQPPTPMVLVYAVQAAVPLAALLIMRLPRRPAAMWVALIGDLVFTASTAAQHFLPTSTVSGVSLFLSVKMLATALFFPWPPRFQLASGAVTVALHWLFLGMSGAVATPQESLHQVIGPFVAYILSVAGAAGAERGRRELFERDFSLREEVQVASRLARVGRVLIESLGTPALFDRLCQVTTEVLECDSSHTLLWVGREQAYVPVAGVGYPAEQWEAMRVLKVKRESLAPAFDELEWRGIHQMHMRELPDPAWSGLAEALDITVAMGMALRRGDEMVGFHSACYLGRVRAFTPQQERVAQGIAQLATLALENHRLIEELEASSRMKSEFVATITHELRNPLNTMIGYTDLLVEGSEGPLTDAQTTLVQRVARAARQLVDLVNATLDLSRIETGQLPVDLRRVDVLELVSEIADEITEWRSKPGLHFGWEVEPGVPKLLTDATKLKVVLKNLIGNAIKFTEQGSVQLEARERAGGVEFLVIDTGVGIGPEQRQHVFDAFYQADAPDRRRLGGVGLGLYIVRRLLDLLQGQVSVQSTVGQGSTFRVWVPQECKSGSATGGMSRERIGATG